MHGILPCGIPGYNPLHAEGSKPSWLLRGRKAIQGLVLMEHLGRPKTGHEAHWQWTLQRLTQDCLSTEDGYIVHSIDTYKHAKTLLALAYLWRVGDKRWVGDEVSRHQVEWMSQHHERLARSEEATIDTFLVDWRRAGLMAVADVREDGKTTKPKCSARGPS